MSSVSSITFIIQNSLPPLASLLLASSSIATSKHSTASTSRKEPHRTQVDQSHINILSYIWPPCGSHGSQINSLWGRMSGALECTDISSRAVGMDLLHGRTTSVWPLGQYLRSRFLLILTSNFSNRPQGRCPGTIYMRGRNWTQCHSWGRGPQECKSRMALFRAQPESDIVREQPTRISDPADEKSTKQYQTK